jgi:hypothetical protein
LLGVGQGGFCEDGLQGGGESVQAVEDSPWRQGAPLVRSTSFVSHVGLLQFSMWVLGGGEEVADLEEPWVFSFGVQVMVMAGKDAGLTGTVMKVIRSQNRVLIEGRNLVHFYGR